MEHKKFLYDQVSFIPGDVMDAVARLEIVLAKHTKEVDAIQKSPSLSREI